MRTIESVLSRESEPFNTSVELVDGMKRVAWVTALVDDGAMAACMDVAIYNELRTKISGWGPSTKFMRMADGRLVPAVTQWMGKVGVKGLEVDGSFEVFDSRGSWQVLFGKPLLSRFKALHEYEGDTIRIRVGDQARTVFNDGLGVKAPNGPALAAMVEEVEDEEDLAARSCRSLAPEVGSIVRTEEELSGEESSPKSADPGVQVEGVETVEEVSVQNQEGDFLDIIKSFDDACKLSGVPVDSVAPLDREVDQFPFAKEDEIPTFFTSQETEACSTKYSYVFETPRERQRVENEERLKWIRLLDERREKAFRAEERRLWRGRGARRWCRWKDRCVGNNAKV